uniref:Fucosyltransferase n=1 Tax=Populus davidiana TaxID=266767 RepID=A0A6M2E8Z9_9ROSI
MQLKPLSTCTITLMLFFTVIILFFSGFLEFPSITTSITSPIKDSNFPIKTAADPFTDLFIAFKKWDSQVGCVQFREKYKNLDAFGSKGSNGSVSVQVVNGDGGCSELKMQHVSVLVKGWTWIPSNLDNLYSCRCGLSCMWTKSSVLADKPDALLFETAPPPFQRRNGDPLHVYMDLEAGRKRSGHEDLFISYHAEDDVQSTYAGALFHNVRNFHMSRLKDNDTLVYWSSSRCLADRNQLAKSLLSLLPHHSFGKCLNNVGGLDMALSFYPECASDASVKPKWWDHLHCAMSHYKFVLAIENTWTESYVTEKLFYALDSGAVPIYFGAPNVLDFVPPHSIIDGTKFSSKEELASYLDFILILIWIGFASYHSESKIFLLQLDELLLVAHKQERPVVETREHRTGCIQLGESIIIFHDEIVWFN